MSSPSRFCFINVVEVGIVSITKKFLMLNVWIIIGTLLGTYEDNRFKSESKKPALESVDLFGLGGGPELEKKLKYTEDVCAGIILGKELVNAPANVLTPG